MKGVIVQVGEPKSIVLFNNGKLTSIPTPADCHVGMVVSVKLNNKPKILLITLAAILLLGIGIYIGATFLNRRRSPQPWMWEYRNRHEHMQMRNQKGEGRR
ncbi:MAG: hypothetical protein LBU99_05075 [Spirochaetaceae bacterium]|jgi:hypothetical protein|nr:hypothetical protein [Spirochaetaceae bacterium]